MSPGRSLRAPSRAAICMLSILTLGAVGGCADLESDTQGGAVVRWGGDVLSAGQSVVLSDSLPGDAILAGGDLRFSGVVEGSYLGAGGEQDIAGRVANSVRAAGGTVRLRSVVGRNVTLAGGEVSIEEEAFISRNAYLAGGEIEVLGAIEGSLRVAGGEVDLNGPVGGDVLVEAGRLRVGPDARIEGDLRYRTREGPATIDPSAQIRGETRSVPAEGDGGRGGRIVFRVLRILAFLVAGGVVVTLFSEATSGASNAFRRRPLASLGLGLLSAVLAPLAIGLAAMTLVGIPLAVIAALLFGISLYLAPMLPAIWLGTRLIPKTPQRVRLARLAQFLAGGFVIAVLSALPLLGIIVRILAVLGGLGAAILALQEARPAPEIKS